MYLVSLTYSFHDSSYIKRQTLSGGGHKLSDICLLTTAYVTMSKFELVKKLNKNGLYNNLSNSKLSLTYSSICLCIQLNDSEQS